ncbi:relaxase domain-containing protein [Streptomyces spinoverrucosus]|uniref:MobF family relaxase n=1 Tax=Streptomyces spinoverrucosus TaxID=284043 RepID=UPI001A296C1C|nr:relaxase domain-containing protein [Streptomyces spinoverrucosus]
MLLGWSPKRRCAASSGEGLHPEADRITAELTAADANPAEVRRAVKLGYALRARTSKGGSVAAWDCAFRPSATVTLLWAFGTGPVPGIVERSQVVAISKVVAWLEDNALIVRSGAGCKDRMPARFRHFDNRDQKPLLHDHVVISVKVQREDGTWAHLHGRVLLEDAVAAGALYNQLVLEEVCAALGLATRPRIATLGKRPVMEIAGIPSALIDRTSTRNAATMSRLERTHGGTPVQDLPRAGSGPALPLHGARRTGGAPAEGGDPAPAGPPGTVARSRRPLRR